MRARRASRRSLVASFAGALLVVFLWLFLAPVQLGGSTAFSLISGNSMEPLLHRGHLAVIRVGPPYRVGDVALYESEQLGRSVLHRITGIDDGVLTFKGDNNDFIDPEEVPMSALVGTLWFHVPHVGAWMEWLRVPWHAALVMAGVAAVAALAIFGGRTVRRRRGARPAHVAPARGAAPRPLGGWAPALVALVLIVALGVVGFASPLRSERQVPGAYRHEGEFSYSAELRIPNPAYPSGKARTGQPVFFNLFDDAEMRFDYRFVTELDHRVGGTISLVAFISDATTWHEAFDVGEPVAFNGDEAAVTGTFPLRPLKMLVDQLAANSGLVNGEYSVFLQPTVELEGSLDGRPLSSTFSPALPILVTPNLIRINTPPSSGPPGADVVVATDVLRPVQMQSATVEGPATVSVARYRVTVQAIRVVAVALLFLWAVTVAVLAAAHRRRPAPDDRSIAAANRLLVVPVTSLDGIGALPGVEVTDFEVLARLAADRDVPVLVETGPGARRYTAVVDGTRFCYEVRTLEEQLALEIGSLPPQREPETTPRRPRGTAIPMPPARRLLRGAALLLPALLVGSAVMSFTATGVVPSSHLGVSRHEAVPAQLAPSSCAPLAVTRLATGADVTGTDGNDLILGRSGSTKLDGADGNDCIVGVGGRGTKNAIDGGPGIDVCIAPDTSNTSFKRCEYELRPAG